MISSQGRLVRRSTRPLAVLLGAASLLASGAVARATNLVITPTFDSSIASDPNAAGIENAINGAIAIYENKFADPINVTIDFQEMSSGLGGSEWSYYQIPYSTFISHLRSDATTSEDTTAISNLPQTTINPVTGGTTIDVKTANLRAIGFNGALFPSSVPGGYDGIISVNTGLTDIGSPGTTGQYSLVAVVEHEMDEVLGLGSGLSTLSDPLPEDLFRYASDGSRSYTTNSSALAYFSIDGTTDLAQFDNQNDGGDWGDWQSNPRAAGVGPKVQDAFGTPGSHPTLGVELQALDVIGYDLIGPPTVTTPEPGTLTLLAFGAGCLVFIKRHRLMAACRGPSSPSPSPSGRGPG